MLHMSHVCLDQPVTVIASHPTLQLSMLLEIFNNIMIADLQTYLTTMIRPCHTRTIRVKHTKMSTPVMTFL